MLTRTASTNPEINMTALCRVVISFVQSTHRLSHNVQVDVFFWLTTTTTTTTIITTAASAATTAAIDTATK